MTVKIYSFLVTTFLLQGIFADPFHFHFGIQEPVVPFVGRHDFLQNLHEALTRKVIEKNVQYSSITFVTGRGGIGKTETTRKYIETYADAFDNVIWIEAENELEVEKSFRTLAKSKIIADKVQIELESEPEPKANDDEPEPTNEIQKTDENIPNSNSHSQMTDETIQNIYQTLGRENRRTLMIFDNVDKIPWRFLPTDLTKDLNEISSSASNSDVVPPSILILRKKGQSSKSKGQQQMDSVKWLPLTPFTDDDNINYILHYPNLIFDLTSDDLPEVKVIENARLLGQLLGGTPLALKQAMAFIRIEFKNHPEKGLEKYLSLYKEVKIQDGPDSSSANSVSLTSEPESESASSNPIFLTWKITKEKLSQGIQGNLTPFIMNCLPFFPSSKMSIRLLFYIFSGGEEPLRDQRYHNEQAIIIKNAINSLHKYAIVNIDLDPNDPKVDLNLDPDLVNGTLNIHRELQKAVLKAFKEEEIQLKVEQKTTPATKLVEITSWLVAKSQEFLDKVIDENEELSLNELDTLVGLLDRLESAADSFVDGGPDIHMLQVISITRFKVALRFQKLDSFEGEENCRKSLRESLKKLKEIEPESDSSLKDPLFQRKMMELVQTTFMSLAEYHNEELDSRWDFDLVLKCLKVQEIVLEIATQVLGKEHPFRLACLDEKADALWRIKSPPSFRQEALALSHLVYGVYKTLFGKKSKKTILVLHKLAEKHFRHGDLSKSFDLFTQVLDLDKEVFGPHHSFTIITMQNMAAVLEKMGKSDEALEMSKSVLELQQAKSEFVTSEGANDLVKEGEDSQVSNESGEKNLEKHMELSNLHNMANNYVSLNQPAEAYRIWEKLYNEDLKTLGPDDLKTVLHESEMAKILFKMKDYSKAMKMQLHVLEIREKLFGPDDRSTVNTKFDLAQLYHSLGDERKALELYTIVYESGKKTDGEESERTLAVLDNLANVHSDLNNKETAQEMKRQIYMTQKKVFGEDALETINALSELAKATSAVGQDNPETMKEVLEMYKKVYKAKKKLLGPTHGDTLVALYHLSNFQARLGDPEKAMQLLEAAYNFLINSPDHGPESAHAATTLHTMSHVRLLQGKTGLALKLDQKALDIFKKIWGPEHPNNLGLLEEIASILHSQQNGVDEALKYYEEIHSIMSKIYGPETPKTLIPLEIMGTIYADPKKNYKKAKDIFIHVFKARSKTLGARDFDTLTALYNLARVEMEVGKYEEAVVLLEEVVAGRMAVVDHDPEITLIVMDNLAMSYVNLGPSLENYEKAVPLFEQVYEWRRAILGEEQEDTLATLENVATFNFKLGHVEKAVQSITQVYNTWLKISGPDSPETKKALKYKTIIDLKLRQKVKIEL